MRKKSNSDKYWKLRDVKARHNLLLKSIKDSEDALKKEYRRMAEKLISKLKKLYMEIQTNPDILNSHLYQYQKYYEMVANIESELNKLGEREVKYLDHQLKQIYKKNHQILKSTFPRITLNKSAMESVINSYWVGDGLKFSDRIWRDKRALAEKLSQGINDAIQLGMPSDELAKTLMEDFNVTYNQAKRIASTELAYVQTQQTLQTYKDAGLTQYRWLTAKDERVCADCDDLDNQIFNIDDAQAGLNLVPKHCNCRCCVLGVINIDSQETNNENNQQ